MASLSFSSNPPAFLFDLDGTLVDSVYQHVLAWREALEQAGTELSVWRIHRRIGMSGGLFVNALLRETGGNLTRAYAERLQRLRADAYQRFAPQVRPLPGAIDLLKALSAAGVPHVIATSGRMETARPALDLLGVAPDFPVITRDMVRYAKPDPDLFLAAAERLGVSIHKAVVVGDRVWDLLAAQRARALSVGLLSGGYGQEELEKAGAYRVYTLVTLSTYSNIWTKSACGDPIEIGWFSLRSQLVSDLSAPCFGRDIGHGLGEGPAVAAEIFRAVLLLPEWVVGQVDSRILTPNCFARSKWSFYISATRTSRLGMNAPRFGASGRLTSALAQSR